MPRCNKRLDPAEDDGLTGAQQAGARSWGDMLQELPWLAHAVENKDFELGLP